MAASGVAFPIHTSLAETCGKEFLAPSVLEELDKRLEKMESKKNPTASELSDIKELKTAIGIAKKRWSVATALKRATEKAPEGEQLEEALKEELSRCPTISKKEFRSIVKDMKSRNSRVKSKSSRVQEILTAVQEGRHTTLCFLVDCTGSMQHYIGAVKDNVKNVVDHFKDLYPEAEFYVSFVGYRDFEDRQRFTTLSFTKDPDEFRKFVSKVHATGGGDTAEDISGGLKQVCNLPWNCGGNGASRILIHIADAPAHGSPYNGGARDDHASDYDDPIQYLQKLNEKGVQYYFYTINQSCDKMVDEFNLRMRETSGVDDANFVTVCTFGKKEIAKFASKVIGTVHESLMHTAASAASSVKRFHMKPSLLVDRRPPMEAVPEDTAVALSEAKRRRTHCDHRGTHWDQSHNVKLLTYREPQISDLCKRTLPIPEAYLFPDGTQWSSMQWMETPFARGACRWAYPAHVKHLGEMVAKRFCTDHDVDDYKDSVQSSSISRFLAQEFNIVKKSEGSECPQIEYVPAYLAEVTMDHSIELSTSGCLCRGKTGSGTATGKLEYFSLEPKLEGEWTKWSNNVGDWDWERAEKTLLEFAKWTFDVTRGYMMVSDLQGVKTPSGNFRLTDPVLLCREVDRFGSVNFGKVAMDRHYEMCKNLLEKLG